MVVPINVAVVPHGDPVIKEDDAINDLTRVTAALQIQVTRDFAPIWGVSANVTPFLSLDHVPVGYMVLVLAAEAPIKTHGVHYAAGGRPFALVKYVNLRDPGNWSLAASHELLEMLSDPWGNRVVTGRAIEATGESQVQQVEYLLEVCDPCQESTYLIDGVLVSDFVTPDYYSPRATAGLRYSFTGKIVEPRTVLKGGYITWRIPGSEQVWQQHGPLGDPNEPEQLRGLSPLSMLSLREAVDSSDSPAVSLYRKDFPDAKTLKDARAAYSASKLAAKQYGGALRRDIRNLLPVGPGPDPRSQSGHRVDLLDIIELLGSDREFYEAYAADPQRAVSSRWDENQRAETLAIERDVPVKVDPKKFAPQEVFAWYAKRMKQAESDRDFGDTVFLPGGALWWLAALGGG
jgi:hypothetical protein